MFYNGDMSLLFDSQPQFFGTLHVIMLVLGVIGNVIMYRYLKNKDENYLLNFLFYTGLLMVITEIYKQWFCYVYVFNREINLWYFPWQLCSMPMYLSLIVKFLDKKKQNVVLVFLASISLFATIMALLFPHGMLHREVFLFIHSFVYHGLIIIQSIVSLLILRNRNNYSYRYSVYLFILLALIAQIINVVSHMVLNDISIEPNMFYISPYIATNQFFLRDIAYRYGILTETIVYLIGIVMISYGLYLLEKKIIKK